MNDTGNPRRCMVHCIVLGTSIHDSDLSGEKQEPALLLCFLVLAMGHDYLYSCEVGLMTLVHFCLPGLGREVPAELEEARRQKTGYRDFEFYTVPGGVFDVPLRVKEAKLCDPDRFLDLGGEIFLADAEIADRVTQIYDDLKFWRGEAERDSDIFSSAEVEARIQKCELDLRSAVEDYVFSIRKVERDDLADTLSQFTVTSTEDYGACQLEILVSPYEPEFLLCYQEESEAEEYLRSIPIVSRDQVYDLVEMTRYIQI